VLTTCRPKSLSVHAAPTGHIVTVQERVYELSFRNQSHAACRLRGYPFAQLDHTKAPRSWTRIVQGAPGKSPGVIAADNGALSITTVTVKPGARAFAYLGNYDGAECGRDRNAALRVGLRRGSASRIRGLTIGLCKGNSLVLSPFTAYRS
jgi:hypothetical protein